MYARRSWLAYEGSSWRNGVELALAGCCCCWGGGGGGGIVVVLGGVGEGGEMGGGKNY